MNTRNALYRAARLLGDVDAAKQGPEAYAKRLVRKRAYRTGNRGISRLLKGFKL